MKLIWIFAIVAAVTLNCCPISAAPLTKWFKTDNNTYYIEAQEKYNWQQSYDECHKKNMVLITLKAYQEDALLLKYIEQNFDPKPEFWLKASDKVDLEDVNKLLGSMLIDFLNIKLDGINDSQIVETNSPDNCVLAAEGTTKACEALHGFICFNSKVENAGQNIQNIVLKFN